jgi:hypothetical protein
MLKAVMVNFAPEDGGVESYILLQLRNFSGLAQVAEFELAARDKQKSGQPAASTARAFVVFRYANSSAPAGVKVTKVPDSCILSQPRSIASLRPAPYSAGLPVAQFGAS